MINHTYSILMEHRLGAKSHLSSHDINEDYDDILDWKTLLPLPVLFALFHFHFHGNETNWIFFHSMVGTVKKKIKKRKQTRKENIETNYWMEIKEEEEKKAQ